MPHVSQLYIYPIKSLGGFSLQSVNVTDRGFEYDRRWMLIDEQNNFLTQREFAAMALLQVKIVADGLMVFHKENISDFITVPFTPLKTERVKTNIWGVTCEPQLVSNEADKWFSAALNASCRLVYMDDATQVKIDERYNKDERLTSFSDGFPILMISEASLEDLNNRASEQLDMNRFRPNLVITDTGAYEEDSMKQFEINGITFYGAKPSARCVVTTINQLTAEKGKEPLKTLATYRSRDNKIYFGENVIAIDKGPIKIGDEVLIKERKEKLFQ